MRSSEIGAFAQGIAGGVSRGVDNYIGLAMKKIDQKQQASVAKASQLQGLFSNKDLPLKVRKKAWLLWCQENKDWKTGIEGTDMPDDMWNDGRLDAYLKRGLKIRDNKEYSLQDKIKFTAELYSEASSVLGRDATAALKSSKEGYEQEGFSKGISDLQTSGALTPQSTRLLSGSPTGRKVIADRMKKPTVKMPSIAQYKTKNIGGGKSQEFKWNPKTKEHDIIFGKAKSATKVSYHKVSGSLFKVENGKATMIQERSIEGQSVVNAMNEPNWRYLSEPDQAKLIAKHRRLLTGESAPATEVTQASPQEGEKAGFFQKALDKYFPSRSTVSDNIGGKKQAGQNFYPVGTKRQKQIMATGVDKKSGRKVIQYSDGSIEYAKQKETKTWLQ